MPVHRNTFDLRCLWGQTIQAGQ